MNSPKKKSIRGLSFLVLIACFACQGGHRDGEETSRGSNSAAQNTNKAGEFGKAGQKLVMKIKVGNKAQNMGLTDGGSSGDTGTPGEDPDLTYKFAIKAGTADEVSIGSGERTATLPLPVQPPLVIVLKELEFGGNKFDLGSGGVSWGCSGSNRKMDEKSIKSEKAIVKLKPVQLPSCDMAALVAGSSDVSLSFELTETSIDGTVTAGVRPNDDQSGEGSITGGIQVGEGAPVIDGELEVQAKESPEQAEKIDVTLAVRCAKGCYQFEVFGPGLLNRRGDESGLSDGGGIYVVSMKGDKGKAYSGKLTIRNRDGRSAKVMPFTVEGASK